MGRTKEPARMDVVNTLMGGGAHTMKQLADKTGHSTRTVSRHLNELVSSGVVKRLDLRKLGTSPNGHKGSPPGYSKNAPMVFYQIDPFAGPTVPDPHISLIVRKGRTLGTI